MIDGSQGEGGGQILRSSLALSCITGRPFRIVSIRAARPKPGLRPQHLVSVRAAAKLTEAEVEGATVGSSELEFRPGPICAGTYCFDIGTAGAVSLVLQTVLLPAFRASSTVTFHLTGGTHVPFSPAFDYLALQFGYWLKRMGLHTSFTLARAGYYPTGGGSVRTEIEPAARIAPLLLKDRGSLVRIFGISAISNLPTHVAERQQLRAERILREAGYKADIELRSLPSHGQGTMLLLSAEFERTRATYFSLGARGKPAEKVAKEAATELLRFLESDATVDEHAADQIMLPLAIADGESVYRVLEITQHAETHAEVIRRFLPAEVTLSGGVGEPGEIRIRGCPLPACAPR